jgi:hypothetical protein
MKTKIIPANEFSSKTLRAKDYIFRNFKVTYQRIVERTVVVNLDAPNVDEAESQLLKMEDTERLVDFLRAGRLTNERVLDGHLVHIEEDR